MLLFVPIAIDRPYYRKPYVTYAIMTLCVAVELVRKIVLFSDINGDGADRATDMLVALGYIAGHGSLFTLFTSMFTHSGILHLVGNLLFFYPAGVKVEDSLGHGKFLLLYLACGIAANMIHTFLTTNHPIPMVGASGAIAGVLGALMVLYPYSKVRIFLLILIMYFVFNLRSWLFLGLWFLWQASRIPSSEGSGVAFGAHFGGFLAGAVWMWSFYYWNSGEELEMADAKVIYAEGDF